MSYEYLEHHGILGQKWGVRRYQNPDGSYTAEGKKRHAADGESTGSKIKSGLRKAQHVADKATIIRAKTKVGSTDTYDKATKGPMGQTKSRRQADYEARRGISGTYEMKYLEGKKVREAEKREKEYEERISMKEAKKLNKDAKSRLSGDVNQNAIGIYQKNGDILFVDRKIAEKYGPGVAEKKALEYIEKATRERKKLKKATDYAEEKALVDKMLKDFNGDAEELAVLKDLERSYK